MRIFILFTAFILLSPFALVKAEAPSLSADEPIEFDGDSDILIARGNAVFNHDDFQIIAEQINFDRKHQKAIARGNVRITQPGFRIVTDYFEYSINQKNFSAKAFRLGTEHIFAKGSSFSGTPKKIIFKDATIYYGEPESVSPQIQAREIILFPEEKIEAERLKVRIGSLPIATIPSLSQNIDELNLRFQAEIGYQGNLGTYIRTQTLLPGNEKLDLGANLDLYTQRGLLLGPAFDFAYQNESTQIHTEFESGYINDFGDRGEDIQGQYIDKNRSYLHLRHRQSFGESTQVTGIFYYQSDSEFSRDFRPDLYEHNQQPYSYIEVVHRLENAYISVSFLSDTNQDYPMAERLPEIRYDRVSSEIFNTGIFQNLSLSFAQLRYDYQILDANESYILPNNSDEIDEMLNRFDSVYTLKRPIHIQNGLNFTPLAGVRYTHYSETENNEDSYDRFTGELGFDLDAKFQATWDYKNETWGIYGLRHTLRPVLRYRYHPTEDQGNEEIIQIDDTYAYQFMPAMDLEDLRNVDDLKNKNLLRLGIQNLFETHDKEGKNKRLFQIDAYQDVLIGDTEGEKNLYHSYILTRLHPASWLKISSQTTFDTGNTGLVENILGIDVTNADLWRSRFYINYLDSQIDQYVWKFDYQFNHIWGSSTTFRWDGQNNELTEQRYALRQKIGHSWETEYRISLYKNNDRSGNVSFSIHVNLMRF